MIFEKDTYKIVVVGLGYVGLSNAILLAQHNEVIGVDTSQKRVDLINDRVSPVLDEHITRYLSDKDLNLVASTNLQSAIKGADYIIVATPTDYDVQQNIFNTSTVETVIQNIVNIAPEASIIIKSTVPIGFTENINSRLPTQPVIFSPEFLREGNALLDNLYPSRIIIGDKSKRGKVFAALLKRGAIKQDVPCLYTDASAAEAIKLFSNTYLAMRVAFFNEVDSFAISENLISREIVTGVSLDPRIGDHYNNPSFGYGGYCLPKDTKQLLANYQQIPQNLMTAIVAANHTRKTFITDQILERKAKTVGVYRLIMKDGSDNFRESAIQDIANQLSANGIEIIIHEPTLKTNTYQKWPVYNDIVQFKKASDLIIANRLTSDLSDSAEKVFSRDLFHNN